MGNLKFFNLASRWKMKKYPDEYFTVLKAVMNHYFDTLIEKRDPKRIILVGDYNTIIVATVLTAVGYSNYSIEKNDGYTEIKLRNTL